MTPGDWAFALVVFLAALCTTVCWVVHHVGWKDGHEAGRLYERNRFNLRRLDHAHEEIWGPAGEVPDFDGWLDELAAAGAERLASTGELALLTGTDTGAFRAITDGTDAFIAQMAAEEDAYRKGLAS